MQEAALVEFVLTVLDEVDETFFMGFEESPAVGVLGRKVGRKEERQQQQCY